MFKANIRYNESLNVKIFNASGNSNPQYKTPGASGMDLMAFVDEPVTIQPGQRALIRTGLYLGIPAGFEVQIRPRSGLAINNGVSVLNTPGTIDADYRGEVGVILINMGSEPFTVYNGDRIAQMVLQRVPKIQWCSVSSVNELGDSQRGEGGFGSTGVK